MHRNTYLVITLLAVFAALVLGVNVGRKFGKTMSEPAPTPQAAQPMTAVDQTGSLYTNSYCGFSLTIPNGFQKLENASGSAILSNPEDPNNAIVIMCKQDIPRSSLPLGQIESVDIASAAGTPGVKASLYHETSAKDGTPIDALLFTHPTNGMDVFIAGYGQTYNNAVQTIRLIR